MKSFGYCRTFILPSATAIGSFILVARQPMRLGRFFGIFWILVQFDGINNVLFSYSRILLVSLLLLGRKSLLFIASEHGI